MGLIANIVDAAVAIGGAVIVNVISTDITEHTPVLARKLITGAARRVPIALRERYLEEWLAHLDECKGTIPKLLHSLGCIVCAPKIAKSFSREQSQPRIPIFWFELWRELEFKIIEDHGNRFVLDTDFHLAKVRLSNGQTRFASFEEHQFRRLKSYNKSIKAAVCYPVFDAGVDAFDLHPLGTSNNNAVIQLSIHPRLMDGSDTTDWSHYRQILSQGRSSVRNCLFRIICNLRS
jgi:hypothetical protein